MSATLPLLAALRLATPIAWSDEGAISRAAFLADVQRVAQALPACAYAINLCQARYPFMVAFAAAIVRGQVNLLPSSRAPNAVAEVAADYPDCYSLLDGADEDAPSGAVVRVDQYIAQQTSAQQASAEVAVPQIPRDQLAAIVFTSGSTGKPSANPKTWAALFDGVGLGLRRFALHEADAHRLVGTVPAQHMYGLETTVLYPMFSQVAVFSGRPFYPEDVRRALLGANSAPILVTTPVHLRACVLADLHWPALAGILCATAPLDTSLALEAEAVLAAPVHEIYGCTETGAIASRRTSAGSTWHLFDGMQINTGAQGVHVSGPQLAEPMGLSDIIEIHSPTTFDLIGRETDRVNIAGKRASLADLNLRLTAIEGVDDGVFWLPQGEGDGVERLLALVVSSLDEKSVLARLSESLDPVFLPRPLLFVERLPRNATGKLPRGAIEQILQQLGRRI